MGYVSSSYMARNIISDSTYFGHKTACTFGLSGPTDSSPDDYEPLPPFCTPRRSTDPEARSSHSIILDMYLSLPWPESTDAHVNITPEVARLTKRSSCVSCSVRVGYRLEVSRSIRRPTDDHSYSPCVGVTTGPPVQPAASCTGGVGKDI